MRRHTFLLSLFLILLNSCGKEAVQSSDEGQAAKTQQVVQDSTYNTWGIEFESEAINNESSKELLDKGSAVAFISYIDGGSATGFFVSANGYFLTNHHVISSSRCTRLNCKGIKIIRDFRFGGKKQVFTKFEVISLNSTLDYALIKVDLGDVKEVPYLKLYNESAVEKIITENSSLEIIGHPFGSGLRKSKAELLKFYLDEMRLKSIALSGNSGSPVIDTKSNKVVSLYWGGTWDKGSVKKNGEVDHYGISTPIPKIIENLEKLFGKNNIVVSESGLSLLSTKKLNDEFQDVAKEEFSDVNSENLFGYFLGRDDFKEKFHEYIKNQYDRLEGKTYNNVKRGFDSTLYSLTQVLNRNINNGEEIISNNFLTGEMLEKSKEILEIEDEIKPYATLAHLLRLQEGKNHHECLEVFSSERETSAILRNEAYYCGSVKDLKGEDLVTKLEKGISEKETLNEDELKNFYFAASSLYDQLKTIDQDKRGKLRKVLERVNKEEKNLSRIFKSEAMLIGLENDGDWEEMVSKWFLP